jgi:hypothetical protein
MAIIYALVDPRSGEVRYIGLSRRSTVERLRSHLSAARNSASTYCHFWLTSLLNSDLKPLLVVVEETDNPTVREQFWIRHYRQAGCRLTNCTDGGEGMFNPTPETRRKMSETQKRICDPEVMRARRALSSFTHHSEETKARMRRPKTERHRINAAEAVRRAHREGRIKPRCGDENPARKYPERLLRGEANGWARFTEMQIREIRRLYESEGISQSELGRRFNARQGTIWQIVNYRTWKHLA